MLDMFKQRWNGLSPRERFLAALATGVVLLAVLYAGIIDPMIQRLASATKRIEKAHRTLTALRDIADEYAAVRARLADFEVRTGADKDSFSLLPFVEEISRTARVLHRIASMQPQPATSILGYVQHTVEVRFEAVTGSEILKILEKLEYSPHSIRIKRLQVKLRYETPDLLDATLLLSAYSRER
jgi:type II secretory pathway component PulM